MRQLISSIRALHRYLREVSGEVLYDRYLERQAGRHPSTPAMTKREFEAWRIDRLKGSPGTRCC